MPLETSQLNTDQMNEMFPEETNKKGRAEDIHE